MQNVVLAAKIDQGLSDEIVKYTHSLIRILFLKSRRVQRFQRQFEANLTIEPHSS